MPTKETYAPGTPCWIDLVTPDVAAAAEFYGALLGWELAPETPNSGGYRIFLKGGQAVGGSFPTPPEMAGTPAYWTTYLAVADADDAAARARAAGATQLMPVGSVADEGRFAMFTDPTGVLFGIWQPLRFAGAQLVNEQGSWVWSEISTRKIDQVTTFYSEVFGWQCAKPRPDGYIEVCAAGTTEPCAGILPSPPGLDDSIPDMWSPYFAVDDVDAAAAQVLDLGGRLYTNKIVAGSMEMIVAGDRQDGTFYLMGQARR